MMTYSNSCDQGRQDQDVYSECPNPHLSSCAKRSAKEEHYCSVTSVSAVRNWLALPVSGTVAVRVVNPDQTRVVQQVENTCCYEESLQTSTWSAYLPKRTAGSKKRNLQNGTSSCSYPRGHASEEPCFSQLHAVQSPCSLRALELATFRISVGTISSIDAQRASTR
jgi:hypothetical protein